MSVRMKIEQASRASIQYGRPERNLALTTAILDDQLDLRIKRVDTLPGEDSGYLVLLGSCLLPATRLLPIQRVRDQPAAVGAIALVVDLRLSRSEAKERHRAMGSLASCCVKLWEYMRLHGIYSLSELTQDHFKSLAEGLASSGWSGVLQIASRTQALLDSHGVRAEWVDQSRRGFSITGSFKEALGTNAIGAELGDAKELIAARLGVTFNKPKKKKRTAGALKSLLQNLNDLGLIGPEYGLSFEPYPEYSKLAKSLGRAPGRTKNLEVSEVGALLLEAVKWVTSRAGPAIEVMKRIASHERHWGSVFNKRAEKLNSLLGDCERDGLFEQLPSYLSSAPLQERVNGATRAILISCFLIVAIMNARRKDEVAHRKFGLTSESMSIVSLDWGVYECRFYVEKTYKAYVPFFVNGLTFDAWKLLCNISKLLRDPNTKTESGVFCYPFLGATGFRERLRWFNVYSHAAEMAEFFRFACPRASDLRLPAHSFRRVYALIFYYRYEDATLQALQFQLKHLDLETTRQYVVDALATDSTSRIPTALGERHRQARDEFLADLQKEMDGVEAEKFEAVVSSILAESKSAGGFGRLVLKFHAKFSAAADYSMLSKPGQSKGLAAAMRSRGHRLEPFLHGDCMAGEGQRSRLGRCFSPATRSLHKAAAGPLTCTGCPFHHATVGHQAALAFLQGELTQTIARMPAGAVGRAQLRRKLSDVTAAIELRKARLETI